jgi:hypothetical protein
VLRIENRSAHDGVIALGLNGKYSREQAGENRENLSGHWHSLGALLRVVVIRRMCASRFRPDIDSLRARLSRLVRALSLSKADSKCCGAGKSGGRAVLSA